MPKASRAHQKADSLDQGFARVDKLISDLPERPLSPEVAKETTAARERFWKFWTMAGGTRGDLGVRGFELLQVDPELVTEDASPPSFHNDSESCRAAAEHFLSEGSASSRREYEEFFHAFLEARIARRGIFKDDQFFVSRVAIPQLIRGGDTEALRKIGDLEKSGEADRAFACTALLRTNPEHLGLVRRLYPKSMEFVHIGEYIPVALAIGVLSPFIIMSHIQDFCRLYRGQEQRDTLLFNDAWMAAMNANTAAKLNGFRGYLPVIKELLAGLVLEPIIHTLLRNLRGIDPKHIPLDILHFLQETLARPLKFDDPALSLEPVPAATSPEERAMVQLRRHILTEEDIAPFNEVAEKAGVPVAGNVIREALKSYPASLIRLVAKWWNEEGRVSVEALRAEPKAIFDYAPAALAAFVESRADAAARHFLFIGAEKQYTGKDGPKCDYLHLPFTQLTPFGSSVFPKLAWYFVAEHGDRSLLEALNHDDNAFAEAILRNKEWTTTERTFLTAKALRMDSELFVTYENEIGHYLAVDGMSDYFKSKITRLEGEAEGAMRTNDRLREFTHTRIFCKRLFDFCSVFARYHPANARAYLEMALKVPKIAQAIRPHLPTYAAKLYGIAATEVLHPHLSKATADEKPLSEDVVYGDCGPMFRCTPMEWVVDRSAMIDHPTVHALYNRILDILNRHYHPDPDAREKVAQDEFIDELVDRRIMDDVDDFLQNLQEPMDVAAVTRTTHCIRFLDSLRKWCENETSAAQSMLDATAHNLGFRYADPGDERSIPAGHAFAFLMKQEVEKGRSIVTAPVPILDKKRHLRCLLRLALGGVWEKPKKKPEEHPVRSVLERELRNVEEGRSPDVPNTLADIADSPTLAPEIRDPPTVMGVVLGELPGVARHCTQMLLGGTDPKTYAQKLLPCGKDAALAKIVAEAFAVAPGEACTEVTVQYAGVRDGSVLFRPFRSLVKDGSFSCAALPDARLQEGADRTLRVVSSREGSGPAAVTFLVPTTKRYVAKISPHEAHKKLGRFHGILTDAQPSRYQDFPPSMQRIIQEARAKPTVAEMLNHLITGVEQLYPYDKDIRNSDAYKQFLRIAAAGKSTGRDEVLAFVHSFGDGQIAGKCMCAHLDYIKLKAVQMLGIVPACSYGGYLMPSSARSGTTTVTDNHAHRCAIAFVPGADGTWMAHPLDDYLTTCSSAQEEAQLLHDALFTGHVHPQTALAEAMVAKSVGAASTMQPVQENPSVAADTTTQPMFRYPEQFRELYQGLERQYDVQPGSDLSNLSAIAKGIETLREAGQDPDDGRLQRAIEESRGSAHQGVPAGASLLSALDVLFDPRNQDWFCRHYELLESLLPPDRLSLLTMMANRSAEEWMSIQHMASKGEASAYEASGAHTV